MVPRQNQMQVPQIPCSQVHTLAAAGDVVLRLSLCCQAVMEMVALTLQAAALLDRSLEAWQWVDGSGLLKVLVEDYVANPAASAASHINAVDVLASLLPILAAAMTEKEPLSQQNEQLVSLKQLHQSNHLNPRLCQSSSEPARPWTRNILPKQLPLRSNAAGQLWVNVANKCIT